MEVVKRVKVPQIKRTMDSLTKIKLWIREIKTLKDPFQTTFFDVRRNNKYTCEDNNERATAIMEAADEIIETFGDEYKEYSSLVRYYYDMMVFERNLEAFSIMSTGFINELERIIESIEEKNRIAERLKVKEKENN